MSEKSRLYPSSLLKQNGITTARKPKCAFSPQVIVFLGSSENTEMSHARLTRKPERASFLKKCDASPSGLSAKLPRTVAQTIQHRLKLLLEEESLLVRTWA
ncbi:hypothetical protein AVEN_264830-1 [Araneus ventricosus]|uniref:Uncharacterized protein n=1 Tax=Araneus ventricosus TaxID=182803 RepID=A0A4Y2DZD3_ARAVE|nr:hypothetical protein AVEN_264830-1 [Araneus ventricosus]